MQTFRQFLTERNMPLDDAMKILGLKPGFTKADFEARYKELVRQNHPDRGGDVNKMALINSAADTIRQGEGRPRPGASASATNAPVDRAAWRAEYERQQQEYKEKMQAFRGATKESFLEKLDLPEFARHFAEAFGEPFQTEASFYEPKYSDSPNAVQYMAKWFNDERTIVAEMSVYIDLHQLLNAKVLSNPDDFLQMSISTEILANRKKVKLSRRDWHMRREANVLSDPELIFPMKKLKAQVQKSAGRKMSARDVMLTFQHELGAELSGSGKDAWVYVPVGDYTVALYRMVFMGAASWGINGVYKKRGSGRLAMTKSFVSFLEDETSMNWLWDAFKRLQKDGADDPNALADELTTLQNDYKAKFQKA